ncbi:MAG: addiction module toxin, HicA family [Solirubrobacterales bacterium]|nr:addiction module toxin, HicA family [Solirubrobacterales bacterium]
MAKKYREVRRILRRAGWRRVRTEGSHEVWENRARARTATIPGGGKDSREVPPGTLASIRRATGLEELR